MHLFFFVIPEVEKSNFYTDLVEVMGWKDTVLIMPGEVVSVLIQFGSSNQKYVLHCHNLEHEDNGMMLQFEVL